MKVKTICTACETLNTVRIKKSELGVLKAMTFLAGAVATHGDCKVCKTRTLQAFVFDDKKGGE